MIKIITWITKLIVVALTALLFGACNYNFTTLKGSGNITTEKRTIADDFKGVKVSSAIELVIEQADKTEIKVEADDNLQKSILTEVENGVLIISSESNMNIRSGKRKVWVKMPIIEELQASSASQIRSINTLKGAEISIKTSSASSGDLNLEMDHIRC